MSVAWVSVSLIKNSNSVFPVLGEVNRLLKIIGKPVCSDIVRGYTVGGFLECIQVSAFKPNYPTNKPTKRGKKS